MLSSRLARLGLHHTSTIMIMYQRQLRRSMVTRWTLQSALMPTLPFTLRPHRHFSHLNTHKEIERTLRPPDGPLSSLISSPSLPSTAALSLSPSSSSPSSSSKPINDSSSIAPAYDTKCILLLTPPPPPLPSPLPASAPLLQADATPSARADVLPSEPSVSATAKKTWREKLKHEIDHYWHGTKLFYHYSVLSSRYLWRTLNGDKLSRRELLLLRQTFSDYQRLIPFALFIIVPFMELLLPFAIRLFPGLLPSTYETNLQKEEKKQRLLKSRLEVAKLLSQSVEDMSNSMRANRTAEDAAEFSDLFKKIVLKGSANTEYILKAHQKFGDEFTLDKLTRFQLTCMCRYLNVQTLGTTNFLRSQLLKTFNRIKADDRMIRVEGLDNLTITELTSACASRGLPTHGVSPHRMKMELKHWLKLNLDDQIPSSLLVLSRALMIDRVLESDDEVAEAMATTITQMPPTILPGQNVENKVKLEILKQETAAIKNEQREEQLKKELLHSVEGKEPTLAAPIVVSNVQPTPVAEDPPVLTDHLDGGTLVLPEQAELLPSDKVIYLADVLAILSTRIQLEKRKVEVEAVIDKAERLHHETEGAKTSRDVTPAAVTVVTASPGVATVETGSRPEVSITPASVSPAAPVSSSASVSAPASSPLSPAPTSSAAKKLEAMVYRIEKDLKKFTSEVDSQLDALLKPGPGGHISPNAVISADQLYEAVRLARRGRKFLDEEMARLAKKPTPTVTTSLPQKETVTNTPEPAAVATRAAPAPVVLRQASVSEEVDQELRQVTAIVSQIMRGLDNLFPTRDGVVFVWQLVFLGTRGGLVFLMNK